MLSHKRKIYTITAVSFVVFVALIIGAVVPFLNKIKQSSSDFANQKVISELIQARIDEVESFQSDHSVLKQNLNRIESSFVEITSPVVFLSYLEQASEKAGVLMNTYPYAVKVELDDIWSSIGFRITAGGVVKDCLRFLEMIEQSKWSFEILEFDLEQIPKVNPRYKEFETLEQGDAYMTIIIKAYSGEPPIL
ncbi:MAG: hypothetical protein HQ539_02290 [Parcubacteria group bacterium]|nr:hypothetical protein [Parcubacteria group bacterium]